MALIIFDLDGTLVDSVDGLAFSMNGVLRSFGYPEHTREMYKSFVGNGIQRLVELSMPIETDAALMKKAYDLMLERYQEHYDYNIEIYEGIYALIEQLVLKGHRLAMVTNKHQSMAEPIMAKYFASYPFERIVGRSEVNPKKPDPTSVNRIVMELEMTKEATYFVGDSEVDLQTARNADVTDVIVTWGFRDKKMLKQLEPTHMIDHPNDLLLCL